MFKSRSRSFKVCFNMKANVQGQGQGHYKVCFKIKANVQGQGHLKFALKSKLMFKVKVKVI